MWLDTLQAKHHKALYEIAMTTEPYDSNMTEVAFCSTMATREGFVVVDGEGQVVGCISFSDFTPGVDILIHCAVKAEKQGRWLTKKILNTTFGYAFNILGLPRVSGFCVPGFSDVAGDFLLRMGFKLEGVRRKTVKLPDGLHDVKLFGMLRDECRWI